MNSQSNETKCRCVSTFFFIISLMVGDNACFGVSDMCSVDASIFLSAPFLFSFFIYVAHYFFFRRLLAQQCFPLFSYRRIIYLFRWHSTAKSFSIDISYLNLRDRMRPFVCVLFSFMSFIKLCWQSISFFFFGAYWSIDSITVNMMAKLKIVCVIWFKSSVICVQMAVAHCILVKIVLKFCAYNKHIWISWTLYRSINLE